MNTPVLCRQKILIAEDNPISRRVLEAFLRKWGYEVEVAITGLEALDMLSRMDAPRMAILDWTMPGMEGVQVCRKLRELPDRLYIYLLLLTARAGKQDVLQGLESGADDYLTKPFDSRELRARLVVGERILALQDKLVTAVDEIRFRATHDSLTGINNRGTILECLRKERSRQHREPKAFSIILADIDHFKTVNDTFGHLVGDVVLRDVAQHLARLIRPYDSIGRFGGEEFLVVVPSSGEIATQGLAERAREEIDSSTIAVEQNKISVTVSFGIATSTPENVLDLNDMLRLADDALYRAKANGRNRCEIASSNTRPGEPVARVEMVTADLIRHPERT
jgi:diguanylate cyclase (GGDEF)-like protein